MTPIFVFVWTIVVAVGAYLLGSGKGYTEGINEGVRIGSGENAARRANKSAPVNGYDLPELDESGPAPDE